MTFLTPKRNLTTSIGGEVRIERIQKTKWTVINSVADNTHIVTTIHINTNSNAILL